VTATLPPAARTLLGLLQFRESLGPMYLVPAGRGRVALVVGQMYAATVPLARLRAFNWDAVHALDRAALITMGDKLEPVKFSGRVHLDDNAGYPVTLTATGHDYPTPTNRARLARAAVTR
jgi:hypothetical protein